MILSPVGNQDKMIVTQAGTPGLIQKQLNDS